MQKHVTILQRSLFLRSDIVHKPEVLNFNKLAVNQYLDFNKDLLILTKANFATAFAFTDRLSCRNSNFISSMHSAMYFAYNENNF